MGDLAGRVVGQVADAGQAAPTVVTAATVALPPVGSLVALTLIDPWLGVTFVLGLLLLALLLRGFVADASAAVAGYQRAQGRPRRSAGGDAGRGAHHRRRRHRRAGGRPGC